MSRREPSLRMRLTAAVVGVLGVSLCAFSLVLHEAFSRALWRQFDQGMSEHAHAIANLVVQREEGGIAFDASGLAQLERDHGDAFFEVWLDDGTELARSPVLASTRLPAPALGAPPKARPISLPDGKRGRLFHVELPARAERLGMPAPARMLRVAIGAGTGDVDTTLVILRWLLLASGVTTLGLAALASLLTIRTGLEPLTRVAARADTIDARRLGERLPLSDLPSELRSPVSKLNELLERLEQAFNRERQFAADASHELRTPLTGLRSILEVSISRERAASEHRAAIGKALEVVEQMSCLVENLLMLARLETERVRVLEQPIELRELVAECFAPLATLAGERQLRFENRVSATLRVVSDREKLRLIVGNLLANAVEYTAVSGWIQVTSEPTSGLLLRVDDSGPPIPEGAIERIFDRFVRVDPARSAVGEHHGIGLALVRALSDVLGLHVAAENRADGSVTFHVRTLEPAAKTPEPGQRATHATVAS